MNVICNHKKLYSGDLGIVHTTPEKFENDVSPLKTHRMFSVNTTPEEYESATITGHFGFVFEENSGRKSHHYCDVIFSKSSVFKMFSVDTKRLKRKAAFSNFSGLKSVFE